MPIFVIDQPVGDEEETRKPTPEGAEPIGQAASVRWYRADAIPAEGREPTDDELSAALLELPAIRQLKQAARRRIEREVGDVHDIQADQGKQIEALTALLTRMAVEYLGGEPMSVDTKAAYLARAESVVTALDTPGVTLRSDAEDAGDLILRAMSRSSRVNQIVAEEYLPRRDEVVG